MAKRLTALGLDKIKRTALAEAKRKGDRLEQPIDGQGGYFIAQSSGKEPALAYRYVSPETGKRAKLTYKGPALMPAGVSKWLADQRLAVEEGRDPGAERRKAKVAARGREADTVEHWIERYIELRAKPKTKSWRATEHLLRNHLLRAWEGRTVHSIGQSDVLDLVEAVAAKHPTTGNRVHAWGRALFRWLQKRGVIAVSPFANVEAPAKEKQRERVLSDAELARLLAACQGDRLKPLVKLLVLLGARKSEVADMTWSELDEATRTWNLPGARSKNGRPHSIVLPRQAWAVIESVPRIPGVDHVLAATGDRKGYDRLMQRLRAKLGFNEPFVLHDVRRSVATGMAEIGVEPHIIEACLNHVSGHKAGIAGVYNKATYKTKVTAALQRWADHLDELAKPKETEEKVVQLGARR